MAEINFNPLHTDKIYVWPQYAEGSVGSTRNISRRTDPSFTYYKPLPEEREKMAQELARANLVVLLSEFETHPIAILEALALGCPALVTNTSGMGELCELKLAKGIPLESTPEQIAAAVLEQLRNPLIPEKVNLPSWDDCAEGLLYLYREISTRHTCVS